MKGYIDAHMHVTPSGEWIMGPGVPPVPDAPEDVVAAMDLHGVELGVIVPIRPEDSEFVLLCQERYPKRLIACAMVDPAQGDAVERFRALVEQGARGLKFHPIMQQFPDTDFERLSPLIAEAGKLGVHVQIHCTPHVRPVYGGRGTASRFGASRHPYHPAPRGPAPLSRPLPGGQGSGRRGPSEPVHRHVRDHRGLPRDPPMGGIPLGDARDRG